MTFEHEGVGEHIMGGVSGESQPVQAETVSSRFAGEFNNDKLWDLQKSAVATDSPQEFFAVLESASRAQGQKDMAEAIKLLSDETTEPSLMRNPDDIGSLSNERPVRTTEQILKGSVSMGLGQAFKAISGGLSRHGDGDMGTPTLDDVRMDREPDRKSFVLLTRILAKNPPELDGAKPGDFDGTYEKTRVPSNVANMDLVLSRHNPRGSIGSPDDQIKIYLAQHQA